MKTIFLADAHLKSSADAEYGKCLHFLDGWHGRGAFPGAEGTADNVVDVIVIAGDFFDFWFERNDRIYPEFQPIVKSIKRLKDEGVRICICEGNHDFFLADFFAKRLGIEVYPDALELVIDDLRVFVSHGDTVDRENKRYLALRKFFRSSFTYRLQRMVPLSLLFAIARASSGMSRGMTVSAQQQIVEKMRIFAEERFGEGFDAVILGHSHAETLKQEQANGKQRIFATLGDWIELSTCLVCENGRFSFRRFDAGDE
ncbi:MAG: UDP-2,3-diacylglucosamine diphosphatase [Syntrophales bacterium]